MEIKETLQACIEKHLPFYCYRRPGHPMRIGIQTSVLTPQKQPIALGDSQGFAMVPFDNTAECYFIAPDLVVNTDSQVDPDTLPTLPLPPKGRQARKSCKTDRDSYVKKVAAAVDCIKSGKLGKVVYSHPEFITGDYLKQSTDILNKLCIAYPQAYVAMVNIPGNGLWMCATPELLLSRKGQDLQTIALAGTRRLQVDGTPWDEKNKEEQQIVERYIVTTLKRHCTSISVTPVTTTKAGHLEHLLTRIGMKMPADQNAGNLLAALHPTPAVCGTPKQESYEDIMRQEGYNREFYSGYLGHISDANHFSLYVNLRCMKLTTKGVTLFAGGGITEESDPLTEWEETKMKIETLKRFLG